MLKRVDIQLAEPFSERRLLNQGSFRTRWTPPWIVQPKLNGERCRAIVTNGRCLLLGSTANIIPSVPHINAAMLTYPDGEYDGELYVHGMTFSDIHSIVSREANMHPNYGVMQFHIFDIIVDGINQSDRIVRVANLKRTESIRVVQPYIARTMGELMSHYDNFIANGYEGFIIREMSAYYARRRTGLMMKFKPKATDTYLIVRPYEAISEDGKPLGMVGGFTCVDDMDTEFNVGAGKLTHERRKEIWQEYLDFPYLFTGKRLKVEYQTMSDKNHVPMFSRAVEIV